MTNVWLKIKKNKIIINKQPYTDIKSILEARWWVQKLGTINNK